MPNAGHTYIDPDGNKYIFKVLPSSSVCPGVRQILIGPGAVFSLDQLAREMVHLRSDQVLRIHPNAVVLRDKHAEEERKRLTHISSTTQGSAAAVIDKMWRADGTAIVKNALRNDSMWSKFVATYPEWRIRLDQANHILAEGSQGYSLGINTEFYPYTTSRDCSPASFLSAMGLPIAMLDRVLGTARTLPIRVGGTSGDYYPDQDELNWELIGVQPELTTVTKKIRRIFTYSKLQIEEAIWACSPDAVFLNFCNYVSEQHINWIIDHIDGIGSDVHWLGWGPTYQDVMEFE